jgi:hypothetical protein
MRRHLQPVIVALGVGAVLTVLGCASTEDRQREARAADFNQWLGQDKQSRIRQVGPPDHCTGTQTGGGELCEWRPNGNMLRYRYDTNGIAQNWTYTDRQLGVMETAQESQGGFWHWVTNWFSWFSQGTPSSKGGAGSTRQ